MNKEWSDKNKKMQSLIAKEKTFREGIETLIELRNDLFGQVSSFAKNYPDEAFYQMPFAGAKGFHSTTLAWSLWHIFRIEDVVCHTLILKDSQVLFANNFCTSIKSPIITTANELSDEDIVAFSKQVDVKEMFAYCQTVANSTNEMLKNLEYKDLKRKFTEEDKQRLIESKCVSTDESSAWLVDYWCGKNIKGLIQMPFSRHWIMHVEAMCRIKNKLCQQVRKGVDPIAYCGLSCNHCFLKDWCGGCRTKYNTCSNATYSPGGVCPNASCCKEKEFDGCYDCENLSECKTGFYSYGNDANAVKAMALFIHKYDKRELQTVMDNLHKKYDFKKIQEILGCDLNEGLKILKANLKGTNASK